MKLERRIAKLEKAYQKNRHRLEVWRNRRLLMALFFVTGLVLFTFARWPEGQALSLLIFLIAFPPMVVITRRIGQFCHNMEALLAFYKRQWERQQGRPLASPFHSGFDKATLLHPLHRDLNLFSEKGFMGLWDEFISEEAKNSGCRWLLEGAKSVEEIEQRQRLMLKLSKYSAFLRRSIVQAQSDQSKRIELSAFESLVQQEGLSEGARRMAGLTCGLWVLALTLLALSSVLDLQFWAGAVWAVFAVVSLSSLGGAHRLFSLSLALSGENHSSKLFARFEKLVGEGRLTQEFPTLADRSVSRSLDRVESVSNFLSTQAHPIVHILINLVLPWSAFFSLLMEKQRHQLRGIITPGTQEFAQLDLLSSSVFLYHHQTSSFAEVAAQGDLMVKGIFHPLLERSKGVTNDFEFPRGANQVLITGSNMSGKSTFLRTIAINQLLALAGLPVFAQSMSTSFAPVISCIQVSDSLAEGLSSFYAEVVCLRRLHERVKDSEVFYFVDEIFRGTNNRERLIGSTSFLKELSKYPSRGFVTTHDLELAELESSLPGLKNFHFRDEIHDGKMSFPYKIFHGVCPTTNALRIMKSEGLPVDFPTT